MASLYWFVGRGTNSSSTSCLTIGADFIGNSPGSAFKETIFAAARTLRANWFLITGFFFVLAPDVFLAKDVEATDLAFFAAGGTAFSDDLFLATWVSLFGSNKRKDPAAPVTPYKNGK